MYLITTASDLLALIMLKEELVCFSLSFNDRKCCIITSCKLLRIVKMLFVMYSSCLFPTIFSFYLLGFENGYSMVVHTSVPFGIQNLEESFDQLEPIVMKNLRKIFPSLPQPTSSKFQRWRYSQTHKPYPGSPGSLVLHSSPLLIAGGDSFGQSTFDGCIDSSAAIVDNITKLIERSCK